MKNNKDKYSDIIFLITSILLYLNLTQLHDVAIFKYLLVINFVLSFIIIIYKYRKDFTFNYFKNNFILILLVIFCGISVIYHGFDLTCMKDYAYIVYFLIVGTTLFNKDKKTITNVAKYIFYLCLTINVVSMILALLENYDITFLPFKLVDTANNSFNFYGLYSNPNSLGVGSFLGLILFSTFYKKKKNYADNIYVIVLLVFIALSGSRASLISIVIYYILRFLLTKKEISKVTIARVFTVLITFFFSFMSVMIVINNDKHQKELVGFEKTINSLSTKRYTLWKYSMLSMDDLGKVTFGLTQFDIGEQRFKQIPSEMYDNYDHFTKNLVQSNNNHNGFVQFLTSYGIICMALVIIWIYFGIINSDYKVVPIIIAILCLNMFENEFVNSHSLTFLLLCYFLYYKRNVVPFGWIKKIFSKLEIIKDKIRTLEYKAILMKLKTTGFFSIFLASVFGKVVVFLANIILARLLSKSDYGLYAYIFNCFSILTLLGDFGTSSAAMQYISENINSEKEQFKYLKYSVVIGSLLSIVSGLLIVTSPLFYPYTIDESAGIVQLFFLIPFITTIANIFAIILRAHQKNKQFALYNFLTVFVNYLLLVPLTCLMGIKGVVYATYGYHIFAAIYAIYLSRHYLKNFFHKYTIKAKEKIEFIKFSFIMQVNITLSHLLLIIDTFVIGLIISDSNTIATYKVANSIPQALAFIPTCVVIYILPYFIKHNKERKWLNTNIKKIIIYGSVVYGIFAGGLILFSNLIITILYGAQYKEAVLPFCILILGFYFNATFTVPCSSIMQGLRKVNVNLIISVISLVLNLILNFIFINIFGFVGVAITTTLIQIITSAYYLYYLKKKIMIE